MGFKLRQGKLITRFLPAMVWVTAIVAVGFLFVFKSETVALKGIVFSHEQTINSVETGYIRSIPVTLYQQVRQGDTLAVIKENTIAREEYDNTLLHAKQATAEAELMQLKAELEAAENKLLIELKAVGNINELYKAQLLTYLRLSKKKLGLLIDFNEVVLRNGIARVVNNL